MLSERMRLVGQIIAPVPGAGKLAGARTAQGFARSPSISLRANGSTQSGRTAGLVVRRQGEGAGLVARRKGEGAGQGTAPWP